MRSWLSPIGKFYSVEDGKTHDHALAKYKIGTDYDDAWNKGFVRIANSGEYLFIHVEGGNTPSRRQMKAAKDLVIELNMKGLLIDTGSGFRGIWKADNIYESTEDDDDDDGENCCGHDIPDHPEDGRYNTSDRDHRYLMIQMMQQGPIGYVRVHKETGERHETGTSFDDLLKYDAAVWAKYPIYAPVG